MLLFSNRRHSKNSANRDYMTTFRFIIRIFLIILSFSPIKKIISQPSNLGLPFITQYTKAEYGAGTQNWDLTADEHGMIYIANNDGLLVYDGKSWQVNPLPNKTIVRSVAVDPQGNILAGGQDEVGFFSPNSFGILIFHSLKDRLPESFRQFEDVWDLHSDEQDIWFRTKQQICKVTPEGAEGFRPEGEFEYFTIIAGRILAFDSGRGILEYVDGSWELLSGSGLISTEIVTSIVPHKDGLWVATARSGIWELSSEKCLPLTHSIQEVLKQSRLHSMIALSNGNYALGTSLQGIFIVDQNANPLSWLNKDNALQQNYILTLFEDKDHNLWAGLNNGIDFIELCSPYRRFIVDKEQESTGYSMVARDQSWWMATGTGLYQITSDHYSDPLSAQYPQLVENFEGQVWGLNKKDQEILVAHHEGSFIIDDDWYQINGFQGVWGYLDVPGHEDLLAAGTYEGINILKKVQGKWKFLKRLEGLEESSRMMAADDHRIWMAHPYRGVFSIDFSLGIDDPVITKYDSGDGLPDDNYNNVFSVLGEVLIGTIDGVYSFDDHTNRFVRQDSYQKAIGKSGWMKIMKEDQEGNIWFVMEEGVGVLRIKDEGLGKQVTCQWLPELSELIVKGHEFIFPYDQHHIFFGVDNGFIRFDPTFSPCTDRIPTTILSKVWLQGESDSLIFGGFMPRGLVADSLRENSIFPHNLNTFRFEIAATMMQKSANRHFRFFLEGFDDNWLSWTQQSEKEYTNLPPGEYTFFSQTKDAHGNVTEPTQFSFTILPPWYASQTAKFFYILLGILFIAGLLLVPQRKFQEEREKLESDLVHQQEERKREVTDLRNQSLQSEISHKNSELATATMHLVQKNETLSSIRTELEKLNKEIDNKEAKPRIRSLLRMMNQDERLDKDWEQFAHHFDQVHSDFLKRLQEQYPHLTPKDHRLCAYLRMNLSSKEIAPMMNISVRGVEIGRYRLRKKLSLNQDQNLNEFMMRF